MCQLLSVSMRFLKWENCVVVIVRQLVLGLNLHDFLTFLDYLLKRCLVFVLVFVT